MSDHIPRRRVLKLIGTTAAVSLVDRSWLLAGDQEILIGGRATQILVSHVSPRTVRISLVEHSGVATSQSANDGALSPSLGAAGSKTGTTPARAHLRVDVSASPLVFTISNGGDASSSRV